MAFASSRVPARGFSQSTCLPAAAIASAISRCRALPTTIETMSMESSPATSRQSPTAFS